LVDFVIDTDRVEQPRRVNTKQGLGTVARFLAAAGVVAITLSACSSGTPSTRPEATELTVRAQDAGKLIQLDQLSVLRVALEGQPSTGYVWQLESVDGSVLQTVDERVEGSGNIGGVDQQVFKLVGVAAGTTTLRFVNRRPWEKANSGSKSFEIQVAVAGAFSGPEAVGTARQPLVAQGAQAAAASAAAFPTRYDTCDTHGCVPIKDQGGCGACWAFATNSAFENRLRQIDNVTRDLSEQYLVSCGFGSCAGSGPAFEAYVDAVPAGEPGAGAVYEQDFPYVAADVPCSPPHVHHEKVINEGERVQILWTQEEMIAHTKAAIYYEGPVVVGACGDGNLSAYTGGIFRTVTDCMNHNLVLTGWDDNGGDGYWLARNSWGSGWGEGGTARIAYGADSLDLMNYGVYGTTGTNARYRAGATILAKDWDSQKGTTTDGAGNVNDFGIADFLCYFGVDLTGVSALDLNLNSSNTGGLMMARVDAYATYGEIARRTMQPTGGQYQHVVLPITPMPGVHTLCLWGETGNNLFSVQSIGLRGACTPQCGGKSCGDDGCGGSCGSCGVGQVCSTSNQCVAAPARYRAGDTVQVEAFTSQLGTQLENNGTTVGYFDAGDSLCFDGVDLTGVSSVDVSLASATTGGVFSLRRDGVTGAELARTTVQATGGWGTWLTKSLPITATSGVHTLCIKGETGGGIANFDWLKLSGSAPCTPQCGGTACGADGCGGTCGTCAAGQSCNSSNQCVGGNSCTSSKLSPTSASASSVEGGNSAASAIDGNVTGTRWSSLAADPQWLLIDFGARRHFDHVVLRWETAASASYDIQVSDNGTTFQTVKSNAVGAGGVEDVTALDAAGRYLRVYSKARKTQWGVSLWEVEVYGDQNPSCGSTCAPSCSGKQCGSDGCSGSCGVCATGQTCSATNQCVATPSTCTDVALTRSSALASSTENGGTPAASAIDGNLGTRWSSAATDPQWLQVDLGASRLVRRVVLRWETASSADYDLQVSADGTNWSTKFTGKATGASVDTVTSGLGVAARYVRMYSRKRNTGWGNSLWELEVYGDQNPACSP
jgi:predicted secreted protein